MNKDEREGFQRTLNEFTSQWLYKVPPIMVDGDLGFNTNRRVRTAKYYLGYDEDKIREQGDDYKTDEEVRRNLVRRMRHPMDKQHFPNEYTMQRGRKRRKAQKRRERRQEAIAWVTPGVTKWGGKTVAKCAVPYLNYARAHGWRGSVTSGWRDPWYSRGLCQRMCGAPSCPGRCAGLASNHVGNSCGRFAVDVTDYGKFSQEMRDMPESQLPKGKRIWNGLGAADPVHFGPTGN